MPRPLRLVLVVVGGSVYAAAGTVMGAHNSQWLTLARGTNDLLPFLGVGAALVAVAVVGSTFHENLRSFPVGQAGGYLVVLGAVLYVVSWAIEFAIFGTLTLALGLICLAVTFWARRLGHVAERILVTLAAVGSLTWNTETPSAFLLAGVGLIWMAVTVRELLTETATRDLVIR